MTIKLSEAGKRFNRQWIFRNCNIEFSSPNAYAITGPNGSGKSTLLQTIGGMLQLSEGGISFHNPKKEVSIETIHENVSFCAPYMDVIEEMNLLEFFDFHQNFKPFIKGIVIDEIVEILKLKTAAKKQIFYYSSGMKQRVKLAQAIFSDTDVILLDEPCTNLDAEGYELFYFLINSYCKNRLVIVSSNDEAEYNFCNKIVSMLDLKSTDRQNKLN
jgi:ABC-type multidrug transport system ATPase subunit